MTADVRFEADDLEDALHKLSRHFTDVADGKDSQLLESNSQVEVAKVEDND